jgi:hypothetical protein
MGVGLSRASYVSECLFYIINTLLAYLLWLCSQTAVLFVRKGWTNSQCAVQWNLSMLAAFGATKSAQLIQVANL